MKKNGMTNKEKKRRADQRDKSNEKKHEKKKSWDKKYV